MLYIILFRQFDNSIKETIDIDSAMQALSAEDGQGQADVAYLC